MSTSLCAAFQLGYYHQFLWIVINLPIILSSWVQKILLGIPETRSPLDTAMPAPGVIVLAAKLLVLVLVIPPFVERS
jgi:hypothetical protein